MSYQVFFDFSTGLTKNLRCPKGTLADLMMHVEHVEEVGKVKRTRYGDNPEYWGSDEFAKLSDEEFCDIAERHNNWVRGVYHDFQTWRGKTDWKRGTTEVITPKQAEAFWPALRFIHVPAERWTRDYYVDKMQTLYKVMRGRPTHGISFDEEALTEKQAGQVINLFSGFLDPSDCRLDVPNGHDYLAASDDGGYDWCEKCGAMTFEDAKWCRKRKCPLVAEYKAAGEYD